MADKTCVQVYSEDQFNEISDEATNPVGTSSSHSVEVASENSSSNGDILLSLRLKDMKNASTSMEDNNLLRSSLTGPKGYKACQTVETPNDANDASPSHTCLNKLSAFADKIHLTKYVLLLIVGGFLWGNLWFLTGAAALPGGPWFALFFLTVFSWIGGEIISFIRLPPLLGMLMVGFALRNLPSVNIAQDLNAFLSSSLRSLALAVILVRAGLSLDCNKLRNLKVTFPALSVLPCLLEAITVAIIAHYLLNYSWLWGFMLGFIVSGVSPAVVVPSMLVCQDKRLGTGKGIPTLLIAAGSLDNVVAIAGFGIVHSLTFSTNSLYLTILQGPLEVIIGVVFGVVIGTVTWFFTIKIRKGRLLMQCLILLLGSMFVIFGGRFLGYPGVGPLGSLVLAFAAAYGWRKRGRLDKRISAVFNTIWLIFQPILFGLIGAEVKLANLMGNRIGFGVAVVLIAVFIRSVVTYASTAKSNFNLKEKLFIVLTWLPKATVQATIGPVVLDTVRQLNDSEENITLGTEMLTIAVLSILLTAPIGAIAISLSSSRLLTRESEIAGSTNI